MAGGANRFNLCISERAYRSVAVVACSWWRHTRVLARPQLFSTSAPFRAMESHLRQRRCSPNFRPDKVSVFVLSFFSFCFFFLLLLFLLRIRGKFEQDGCGKRKKGDLLRLPCGFRVRLPDTVFRLLKRKKVGPHARHKILINPLNATNVWWLRAE